MNGRIFLTSYGGGHAQIIAALVPALQSAGFETDTIGLTTAYALLRRQGVAAKSVEALLVPEQDRRWLSLAERFLGESAHPDITESQTRAYFALGLRDLALEMGEEAAIERVEDQGRMAFCPVDAFRRYFRRTTPDLVISTTSPRFELAAQLGAHAEGIPGLAVGDLFLEHERQWILQPGYARQLAVLSEPVRRSMEADGFAGQIRATGNPAFDRLAIVAQDEPRRRELRAALGIGQKRLVLCPASSSSHAKNGQAFLSPATFARKMEALCRRRPELTYMMRAHPNAPFEMPSECKSGHNPDSSVMSVEDAILAADLVFVECSTVGLQAALMGRPVVCLGFADYAVYPRYGLAHVVDDLDEAIDRIDQFTSLPSEGAGIPPLGTATDSVIGYVTDIITAHDPGKS
ncbi:MAG: hypothetical protein VX569_13815 [Pseudomonadota bacterium]|nr:hypothetical protein [Pseudomonadota bacterium]